MALMDFLGKDFFGDAAGYGDLLSDEQKRKMQQQAIMQMGASLLQASGPSRQRIGLGQALGSAYQAGQQAYGQAGQNALQQMLTKQKIDEAKLKQAQLQNWANMFKQPAAATATAQPQPVVRQPQMPPMAGLMATPQASAQTAAQQQRMAALRGTGTPGMPNAAAMLPSAVMQSAFPTATSTPVSSSAMPTPVQLPPQVQSTQQFLQTLSPDMQRLIQAMGPAKGAEQLLNMQMARSSNVSPEMIQTLGLPKGTVAQQTPDGKISILRTPPDAPSSIQEIAAAGRPVTWENLMALKRAGSVSVDLGNKAQTAAQYKRFEKFSEQADVSRGLVPELQTLQELSEAAPQGALAGRLAETFPGFSTAGDAFNAVISRVAPKMRVAGSGAASDKDVDLLRQSLGSLRNAPGANKLIYQAFMDKANIEIERGNIADQVIFNEITPQEGLQKLRELDKRTIISPELKAMLDKLKTGSGQTAGQNPAAKYFEQ